MTELIVIRHGQTDWNLRECFQGQIDVPLNATGQTQARHLALRLAQESVDAVIASDLQRARITAELGSAPWRLPIATQPLWREQHFGMLEGLDLAQVEAQHPQVWQRWVTQSEDYAPPGGAESRLAFQARVLAALQALPAALLGKRVAVFTHGGVLDMLWRTAQGRPLSGPRECDIPNTGINRLSWDGQRLQVLRWADDAHLR